MDPGTSTPSKLDAKAAVRCIKCEVKHDEHCITSCIKKALSSQIDDPAVPLRVVPRRLSRIVTAAPRSQMGIRSHLLRARLRQSASRVSGASAPQRETRDNLRVLRPRWACVRSCAMARSRRLVDSLRCAQDNACSLLEGYPSGQRGQTVNLLAYAFGGSNPPPSTTRQAGTAFRGGG